MKKLIDINEETIEKIIKLATEDGRSVKKEIEYLIRQQIYYITNLQRKPNENSTKENIEIAKTNIWEAKK